MTFALNIKKSNGDHAERSSIDSFAHSVNIFDQFSALLLFI